MNEAGGRLVPRDADDVIDEALDPLDDDARNRVLKLLNDELKEAGIINIGRPETKCHFFTRVPHLVKDPRVGGASCPISEPLIHLRLTQHHQLLGCPKVDCLSPSMGRIRCLLWR